MNFISIELFFVNKEKQSHHNGLRSTMVSCLNVLYSLVISFLCRFKKGLVYKRTF